MKHLSRLTALLLACVMLFTAAAPAISVAETVITKDMLDKYAEQVKDYLNKNYLVETDPEAIAQNYPTLVNPTAPYDKIIHETMADGLTVHMSPASQVVLSGAGAWQVMMAEGVWVNLADSDGNDGQFSVSYAMLSSVLVENAAQLRLTTADGAVAQATIIVDLAPEFNWVEVEPVAMPLVSTLALEVEPAADNGILTAAEANADYTPSVTYSVVINYQFADGKQAASPYTANVAAGSALNVTVNSPAVLGYAPDQASITVNETINEDKTYTVTYQPAQVNFTVKHYQQNLNDDNYTLTETETKTGYTESAVGKELGKTYSGFYSLLYDETVKIAADDSTTVEIYYDRYYYLMNFDLDGGYGVEPIYARYGAPIEGVGTPTKPGYSFIGWDQTIPATMPAENKTFTANWEAGGANYTVVFWYENANDNDYSVAGTVVKSAQAGATVSSGDYQNEWFNGRDSEHFTYNSVKAQTITVNGDGTSVLNVYFTRNTYTITFTNATYGVPSCGKTEHSHSDSCYTACTHAHDINCYDNIDSSFAPTTTRPNGVNIASPENGQTYSTSSYWYLYLNGYWYRGTRTWGFLGYRYNQPTLDCNHRHTDACAGCGVERHTHNDSCYTGGSADTYTVTAKYDADITRVWETDPIKSLLDDGYVFQSSIKGDNGKYNYYSFLEKMPGQDVTMKATEWSGDKYTWYYYLEVLPGQDTTGLTTRTDNGRTYYLYHTTSVKGNDISLTYEEDYFPITGFTQRDSKVPNFEEKDSYLNHYYEAYLYYTRESYTLTFNNYGTVDKTATLLYQQSLREQNYTPAYPSTLEQGGYYFDGWYTNQFFTEDSKVDFNKATMPAGPMVLYAHWAPYDYTVDTYLTYQDMLADKKLNEQQVVEHRNFASAPTGEIKNGDYEFVGWFYEDENGVEKAFDFESMSITRNMKIYGKWSANTLVPYTLRYAVENEDGTLTYIAEDTTGSALALTKTGEDLFEGYQSGYFPKEASHSITMSADEGAKNEFTFIYVPKEKVPYTVRYLEKETNAVLHAEKTVETRDAIVTETFVAITGYMPDAYQKRLVLSADENLNVITFWYVKDDIHAPLHIVHYTQNIEGDGYTVYQESTDINALIGNQYSENPLTIPGFEYKDEKSTSSGTMTAEGLELKLYYDRINYPYEFKFLEQGTDKVLADAVKGTARYQAQVTQAAKTIPGYTLVSEANQAINIAIEDPANVAKNNVRIFYYQENQVTIEYKVVGPNGQIDTAGNIGTVTPASETIKVRTDVAGGSTAAPKDDTYKFVGWFKDEACTQSVGTDAHFTPVKTGDVVDGEAQTYEAATYYAKFVLNKAVLTITKKGMDAGESAIFTVTGPNDFSTKVVVPGNDGSVTLFVTCGDYKIAEDGSWTWKYDIDKGSQTVTVAEGGASVTFTNTKNDEPGLYDEGSVVNNFTGKQADGN